MLTLTPTRLVAAAASQPAFAEVCVEPAPPTATGPSSSIIRSGASSQIVQHVFGCAPFRVRFTLFSTRDRCWVSSLSGNEVTPRTRRRARLALRSARSWHTGVPCMAVRLQFHA